MVAYLVAIAITLILVDVFVASEALSVVAYGLLSFVIVEQLNVDFKYAIAVGLLLFIALLMLHFQVLRALSSVLIDKYVSPTRVKSGDAGLVGQTGTIVEISNKRFVRVGDQLCSFVDDGSITVGSIVEITTAEGGFLNIQLSQSKAKEKQ